MSNSEEKGDDEIPSFEEFFKQLNASWEEEENLAVQKVRKLIFDLDPVQSAAAFCGLATVSCLQSNHIRISNLVHASLRFGRGTKEIKERQISRLFKLLGGSSVGRHEDPAEDVFIATVCTNRGSYRIYEGNWEGSSFFLERFIDIVDSMPDSGRFVATKRSVHALLHLSDIVVSNSGGETNVVGAHYPESDIPPEASLRPSLLCQKVEFTEAEIKTYGFELADLRPFMFNMAWATDLPIPSHQSLTKLDKCPILEAENGRYYLFPQGVSTAIRTHVISAYTSTQQDRDALTANMISSYQEVLQKYQILGALRPPPISAFSPIRHGDVFIQEFIIEVSKGRPLHLVILFDGFYGNLNDWATTAPVIIGDKDLDLTGRIKTARKTVVQRSVVKHGVTLIVFAGWGRPKGFGLNFQDTDDWSLRYIGAHDLCHLSDHPKMKPFSLWRIIRAEVGFTSLGGRIFNINGILNLFGWLIDNEWHIVPHENMPQEDLRSGITMNIPTNHIADVRMSARQSKDRRMVPDIHGELMPVIRYAGSSYFREDEDISLYGSFESIMRGKPSAVYIGKSSLWWCCVNDPQKKELDFRIWDAAIRWLPRIDQVVNERGLKVRTVLEWQLCIEDHKELIALSEQFSSISLSQEQIRTTIRTCPEGLLNRSDNAGESALVRSFLRELMTDSKEDFIDDLINMIFPNKDAKHCHLLPARTYTDHLAESLPEAILIEKSDDANLRLGLGWVDGTEGRFLKIQGTEACVKHLNGVVDKVWNIISKELKLYGKANLCAKLLLNIEAVRNAKAVWERTIRACLATHEDKENVFYVASREIGRFNAASIGSRLLVEMAVCTCPEESDAEPDELDISTLLGYALLLFHLGAWSDAIRSSLYPPEIHVSSFGQVMLDYDFEKTVMLPYQTMFARRQREWEAEKYERLYDDPVDATPVEEVFPADYLIAWEKEYHVSANIMRRIIDSLEDLGISERGAVYEIRRSDLVEHLTSSIEGVSDQNVLLFLSKISLPTRSRWDQTKGSLFDNIQPKDWYPWNFRRRLSLISRPLVELDCSEDPLLLVSPGGIREGVWCSLFNSLNATLDERHFFSHEMKKWIGDRRNQLGSEFNSTVAQKMIDLGWDAESDVLVTKLLNCKTKSDYGDIDVLAWSKDLGVVIAAECKDLYFAKTHKEIGNQINEFLGKINGNGKRDRLRKHFDRLDVLALNISAVGNYVGIRELSRIHGMVVFSERNVAEYAPQIPRDRIHVCAIEMLAEPEELVPALIPWSSKR